MKLSILGKICLLITLVSYSYANVQAFVDKVDFYSGDSVVLSIKASGKEINFPKIDRLGEYPVLGTSSSQQITFINGKESRIQMMQYTIKPLKSFTIEPINIEVDGEVIKTKPIQLKVLEPSASNQNDPIFLQLATKKHRYYKGEPIVTTITFRYKQSFGVTDAKLNDFNSPNFFIKPLQNTPPKSENGYIEYTVEFLMFAKEVGTFTLENQVINVRNRLGFWKKVFSNKLEIEIVPTPNDEPIVGNYSISAKVDKKTVNQNEPINLTLTVEGNGNLEDIPEFQIKMPKQVLYNSKPSVETTVANNTLIGEFIQKVSIISDTNYTIPALEFTYFDLKSETIKTIKTEKIDIVVEGSRGGIVPQIELSKNSKPRDKENINIVVEEDTNKIYLFGIMGFILGAFLVYIFLKPKRIKKEDKETDLIKEIKKASSDKLLYNLLVPYIDDPYIKSYMHKLDENIYKKSKHKIDKKILIAYLRDKDDV